MLLSSLLCTIFHGEPWHPIFFFLCYNLCSVPTTTTVISSHQDYLALLLVIPASVVPSLLCQCMAGHPLARGESDAGGAGGVVSTTHLQTVHGVASPLIRYRG